MISRKYAWRHLSTAAWTYLPMPARDIGKEKIRIGGEHTAGGGQLAIDTAIQLYTFTLAFTYLLPADFAILQNIQNTAGPHHFTDDAGVTDYKVLFYSLAATTPLLSYTAATLTLRQYDL